MVDPLYALDFFPIPTATDKNMIFKMKLDFFLFY